MLIVAFHFNNGFSLNAFYRGRIGVEFFFMVTDTLLAMSVRNVSLKKKYLVQRIISFWYIHAEWLFRVQGGGRRRSGGYADWRQRSNRTIRQVNVSVNLYLLYWNSSRLVAGIRLVVGFLCTSNKCRCVEGTWKYFL